MTDLEMKSLSHEGTRQNYYALPAIFCTTFLIFGGFGFLFFFSFYLFILAFSDQHHHCSQLCWIFCTRLRFNFHYSATIYLLSTPNLWSCCTAHYVWEYAVMCRKYGNTLFFMLYSKSISFRYLCCIGLDWVWGIIG